MAIRRMGLALGPMLYNWPASKWRDFYLRIADEALVDVAYLGEVVCSKRELLYVEVVDEVVERLRAAGKTVVQSTLALIIQPRERQICADIVRDASVEIEINDLSALRYIPEGRTFRIGPFVNIYNEDSLAYLAQRGAKAICLPPELSFETAGTLAHGARRLNVQSEIWAFGRLPLAISSRCYHARLAGLTKDSCQFACLNDQDGKEVDTLDGRDLLVINGVQTMSSSYCNLLGDADRLLQSDFDFLRLSPQDCDMVEVIQLYRDRLDGRIDADEALALLAAICGDVSFCNGFLFGAAGSEFVRPSAFPSQNK